MSVLNSISGVSNSISIGGSALSLIGMGTALVTDQNLKKGIDGFLFDVPLTENISYSAQITDHFTEDNSSIQDHVALEPIKITLTGKVGELVYTKLAGLTFLSAAIDRLAPFGIFSPEQGLMATKAIASAYEVVSAIDTIQKTYNNLADIFTDSPSLNKQQAAFVKFENYFLGRALLSVETPWKTYRDMVIESWSADQAEDTTMETTFTLTFKQMRFIQTITNKGKLLGRAAAQASETENKATQTGGSAALNLGKTVGVITP
jgi:hypothetical protein